MASITSKPLITPENLYPGPGYFSRANLETPYGVYSVTTRYSNAVGKMAVPIGGVDDGESPTVDIVDVHLPTGVKILEWTVQRTGAKPILPAFVSDDDNLVEMSSSYNFRDPVLQGDGLSRSYSAGGIYTYACLRPVREASGFTLTFPPYQLQPSEIPGFDEAMAKFTEDDFSASFVG